MADRIVWSQEAIEDIEAIAAYIERDSPHYARVVASRLAHHRLVFVERGIEHHRHPGQSAERLEWNEQPCPVCGAGTLRDGVKSISQEYKGHRFISNNRGAFCGHCAEGMLDYDVAQSLYEG